MAAQEDIDALRLLINDPDAVLFTDEQLGNFLDEFDGAQNAAAAHIWSIRATQYSSLVNVTESGSSRQMGDLYKNALAMASYFGGLGTGPAIVAGRTRIGKIVRRGGWR